MAHQRKIAVIGLGYVGLPVAIAFASPADAVIFAVAHDAFISGGWPFVTRLLKGSGGIVLDVKSMLDRRQRPAKIELWRL